MPNLVSHSPNNTPLMRLKRIHRGKVYYSKTWYYRARRGKRTAYFPLGKEWASAWPKADEIHRFLSSSRLVKIEEALAKFHPGVMAAIDAPQSSEVATIGEVLDVLVEKHEVLHLAHRTHKQYRSGLLFVMRRGNPALSRRAEASLLALPCSVLTGALASDFKNRMVQGITNQVLLAKAKRSANSYLRNAKSIFGRHARAEYKAAGLRVPELKDFSETVLFRKVEDEYELPDTALMLKVMSFFQSVQVCELGSEDAALPGNAHGGPPSSIDRNVYLAAMLAAYAGPRCSMPAGIGSAMTGGPIWS